MWAPCSVGTTGAFLFAGKTARGEPGEDQGGVVDTTRWSSLAIGKRRPRAGSWAYWAYTRAIIERLYGSLEDGWERVAFTNVVKCNAVDVTNAVMMNNCLRELGLFRQEIEIIRPRCVVACAAML
jgi:hypothetical protein